MNKPVGGDGTVAKAIEVLDIVAGFGREVRFSELVEVSPYPKATLHRFLQTLTNLGMLAHDDERQIYMPGLHLMRLGHAAAAQSSLAPLAAPYLDALVTDVETTVHLAQMERGQIVFVDKRRGMAQFETLAQPGTLAPAHCTGVGKVILAFMTPDRLEDALKHQTYERFTAASHAGPETLLPELDEIRKEGLAFDREEHEEGIASMAAPIMGSGNRVIGAVSVVTSVYRRPIGDLEILRPALLRTASQISKKAKVGAYPIAY